MSTYTIQAGDTFSSIATHFGTTVAIIEALNPGINPDDLQIGQVINIPSASTVGGPPKNGNYIYYSGPASAYPDPSQWASYSSLWAYNSSLITNVGNDAASDISDINTAISQVGPPAGVDERVILCIIMQESGGNVHVSDTISPDGTVKNTGIMQAHDGADYDPNNPAGSILQMVQDGTTGTSTGGGLLQAYQQYGNWYEAFRKYNSGSVNKGNLNDGLGATNDYVADVANRLMGHQWPDM